MILTIVLLIIAAIANACMDVIWNNYNNSIFKNLPISWFNPRVSWENKWNWWPTKVGRFLMSTVFVFVTDFWHLCKFVMLVCISLFFAINVKIWNDFGEAVIVYCIFTITFELFWSKFLIRK